MSQSDSGQELAIRFEVVSPRTGELLTASSSTEDLGTYLADIRDLEARVREEKRAVTRVLLDRMNHNAKWTMHIPGYKLSAPAQDTVEQYDGVGLFVALSDLVADGVISFDAMNNAVVEIVEYKVKIAGIRALEKLPKVKEIIARFRETVPKERYLKIERAT